RQIRRRFRRLVEAETGLLVDRAAAARTCRTECLALPDAEAVLLVDDGETESVEAHALLDERVCADHDRCRAGPDLLQRRASLTRAHASRQQHGLDFD